MALEQDGGSAPYAPPSAVLGIIDAYRERGLQTPFTTEILVRTGVVTEALANRTYSALVMLDFIDKGGEPTEALKGLRLAPSDEFAARLAEHVRDAYAPVFAFTDPAKDTPARVRDAFRVYHPVGQQTRMVTLFLGLCDKAGITEGKRPPQEGTTPRQSRQGSAARKSRPAEKGKAKKHEKGRQRDRPSW